MFQNKYKMLNEINEKYDGTSYSLKKSDERSLVAKVQYFTYIFLKRLIDVTSASLGFIILLPVFLVTIILVRKEDNGPAIFTQNRIGQNGKSFKMYKFRTMCIGADQKLKELLDKDEKAKEEYTKNKKLEKDPRVTKIGRILRRTSIDELPQLLNVIKGDMSLVGPRPYLPREKKDMGDFYNYVIESKPGITGHWQVSGRSNTSFEERLELDREYSEKKAFLVDIGILFKTVGVVLFGKGSM